MTSAQIHRPFAGNVTLIRRREAAGLRFRWLPSRHGKIALIETESDGPAVLLIHGNSSCKEAFLHQMAGPLGHRYRLIAFDLPGHGRSDDAPSPARSYTMTGYADLAVELMAALGLERPVLLGWSLGGHIGLELLGRGTALAGLMIVGTPPVGRGENAAAEGFQPGPEIDYAGRESLSEAEAAAYAPLLYGRGTAIPAFHQAAIRCTDGRARRIMVEAFLAGQGHDQRRAAAHSPVPLAVVSGSAEPFVDNAYLEGLTYRNLWDGRVHIFDGLGHAPFFEAPERFDPLLGRFLGDVYGEMCEAEATNLGSRLSR